MSTPTDGPGSSRPKRPHPIAPEALALLSDSASADRAIDVIRKRLGVLMEGDVEELAHAVLSLGAVVVYLHQNDAEAAGEELASLMMETQSRLALAVEAKEGRSTLTSRDEPLSALAMLERFGGKKEVARSAPRAGEKPPPGTIRAGSLLPPRRRL